MSRSLSWVWPEAQRSYRDLQRKAGKQKFLQSPLGEITAIDDFFTKLEERFIAKRAQSGHSELYDDVVLNITRWHEVAGLLFRADNENVKQYIRQRARQPLKLPILPPRAKTQLEILIDETLEGKYGNTA